MNIYQCLQSQISQISQISKFSSICQHKYQRSRFYGMKIPRLKYGPSYYYGKATTIFEWQALGFLGGPKQSREGEEIFLNEGIEGCHVITYISW